MVVVYMFHYHYSLFGAVLFEVMKIRINQKKTKTSYENVEIMNERQRETQEVYCDEIRNLRCEIETMKTTMDEMKQHMNEMRLQLETVCRSSDHIHDPSRSCDYSVASTLNYSRDKSVSDFGEWINGLELTLQDLEAMFKSKEMVDWASKFIIADLKQRSVHPYPLCAIKGSRNELLIYDKDAWKKMTDQEFLLIIVGKVFKKLLAVFTTWKNENYNKILTSEQYSTLYHSNYARILSFNENTSKLKTKLFHELLL
jgi:hypothetical protein